MKKVFLASVAVLSVFSTSTTHAADFKTLPTYSLTCESITQNEGDLPVILQIEPSAMNVNKLGKNGELWHTLRITKYRISTHMVVMLEFRDGSGHISHLDAARSAPDAYTYSGRYNSGQVWAYTCISLERESEASTEDVREDWCRRNDWDHSAESCKGLKDTTPWPKWLFSK